MNKNTPKTDINIAKSKLDDFFASHFNSLPKCDHTEEEDEQIIKNILEKSKTSKQMNFTHANISSSILHRFYSFLSDSYKTIIVNPLSLQGAVALALLVILTISSIFLISDISNKDSIEFCENNAISSVEKEESSAPIEFADNKEAIIDNRIFVTKGEEISFAPPMLRSAENSNFSEDSLYAISRMSKSIFSALNDNKIKIANINDNSIVTEWFIASSERFNKVVKTRFIFIFDKNNLKVSPVIEEIKSTSDKTEIKQSVQKLYHSLIDKINSNRFSDD